MMNHSGQSPSKSRNLDFFICLGIVVIAFAVYFQLSEHRFLSIDDPAYVTANSHVQNGLTAENIKWAFTSFDAEFWHPVTWLSYMLDTELFGIKPGGYLITNLVLHLLNSALLFCFLILATRRSWESGLIAGLFALHPLHVETVAWIAERKELLCGFFWMTTLILYYRFLSKPDVKRYVFICISFIFGIMSKPMIVTLPFVLLLLDYWPLSRTILNSPHGVRFKPKPLPYLVYEKVPLFIISAAGAMVTLLAQYRGGGIVSISQYSLPDRIASSVMAYVVYLKKTFWPIDLSVFYPIQHPMPVLELGFGFLVLITITGCCIIAWKRFPYMAVGWFWFMGTLIPVIGIIKIGDFAYADRYTYIPLTGIFMIFAFGIRDLVSLLRNQRPILAIIPICIIGCFSWITYIQTGVWKNSETLFSHAIGVDENNYFAHYAMGHLKAAKGNFAEAVVHFEHAVQVAPHKSALLNDLGRAYFADDQAGKAIDCFQRSAEINPDSAAAHFYLGCTLVWQEKYGDAIKHLTKALQCREANKTVDSTTAEYYKKACSHKAQGRESNAISYLEKIIILHPQHCAARIMLAEILMEGKNPASAISAFGISIEPAQLRSTILSGFDNWKDNI